MKNQLLLLMVVLLMLTTRNTSAQTYLDSTSTWYEEAGAVDGINIYKDYNTYYIDGDTTVASVTYYKLYYDQIDSVWSSFTSLFSYVNNNHRVYAGGLREDNQKKFFMLYASQTTENLMFDFNLLSGDSLPDMTSVYGCNIPRSVVTTIDTIMFGAQPLQRFHFNPGLFNKTMYEGIGCSGGLIRFGSLCQAFEAGACLTAYKKGNESIYFGCGIAATGLIINNSRNFVDVYPNPADGQLSVSSTLEGTQTFELFDYLGRLVLHQTIVMKEERINTAALPAGLYFWTLNKNTAPYAAGKITLVHP